ncbi:MAG TPA: peroxiredoxin [Paenalcaligenes hominis]|uniref:Glutathione-dependent peroxiredoxin n=1 Tax=Paenalcaligenes hominis TaxID=643674 RepID=A0A9D2VHX9_9BURK|nr:peroxiredoxin [Paenalcaligenes hominis]
MTIKVGDTVPNATLAEFVTGQTPQSHQVEDLVQNKRIVLFSVPGAFTPTCTERHLPGYLELADAFKAKGIDEIWCVAVNDMFVMEAWGRDRQVNGAIRMMADGSADWMKKLGLVLDLSAKGLGLRAQRFSAYLDNGEIKALYIDEGGALDKSDAQTLFNQL